MNMNEEYIRQQSSFYGKDPSKKITEYHKKVNDAAFEIAVQQPHLLSSRQVLLQYAQERVEEDGYVFKKGKSRAKRHSTDKEGTSKIKRPKTTEAVRLNRIAAINDELKSLDERLMYKNKEREMASNVKQYRRCEELTREMSELKEKKREYEAEKKLLDRKQMKSAWYKKKLAASSPTQSSRSVTPLPQSSRSSTPLPLSPVSHSDSTVYVGSSSDQEELDSSAQHSFSPLGFTVPQLRRTHRLSLSPPPTAQSSNTATSQVSNDQYFC